MKIEEKVIMYDSQEAARKVTMQMNGIDISHGFISIDNYFFNNEDMARYRSCTHRVCECGNKMLKHYTLCEVCRMKNEKERYDALPFQEWDMETPLFDKLSDKYFFSEEDILDYLGEQEDEYGNESQQQPTMRLVLCISNSFSKVSADYWQNDLPEDGDIPEHLKTKVREINDLIDTLPPASYSPGNIRTRYIN